MPVFELAFLLAAAGVAALPFWKHSAEWGYWPSASLGISLLVVALLVVSGPPGLPDSRAKPSAKAGATVDTAVMPNSASQR